MTSTPFALPFYPYNDTVGEGRYPLPPDPLRAELDEVLDRLLERREIVPVPGCPDLDISGVRIGQGARFTVSKRVGGAGDPGGRIHIATTIVAPDQASVGPARELALDLFMLLPSRDWPAMEEGPAAPFTAAVAGADSYAAVDRGLLSVEELHLQTGFTQLMVALVLDRAGLTPVRLS